MEKTTFPPPKPPISLCPPYQQLFDIYGSFDIGKLYARLGRCIIFSGLTTAKIEYSFCGAISTNLGLPMNLDQPPILTIEEPYRGKLPGGKVSLPKFRLMASAKTDVSKPSEVPWQKGFFTSISASPKRQRRKALAAVRRRRLHVRQ